MKHRTWKPELKITAVICALNEAGSLPHVLPKIPNFVDEIILVDGHSTDGTVEVAKRLHPDVKVLYQPTKGKDNALIYGVEAATGDIVVTLDADGSTDPEEMSKFIQPLLEGYDFAKGSRFRKGKPSKMSWLHFLGNWILTIEADLLFGARYTDLCSGYNAFWRKAWKRIEHHGGFVYEPVITLRARKEKLKVIEIPNQDRGRVSGKSKLPTWGQGWGAFLAILKERFG